MCDLLLAKFIMKLVRFCVNGLLNQEVNVEATKLFWNLVSTSYRGRIIYIDTFMEVR